MAPQVGLEPTTFRLTAERSAIELLRNMKCGSDPVSYTHLERLQISSFCSGNSVLSATSRLSIRIVATVSYTHLAPA